ncbi:hypothetical protein ACIRTB_20950 [Streptomyces sp. NPDC101158]|uniref:hypothetical protein n=1 Tax=Streptomyces sp. NPDC101158 TaxID=3366117 RepID=UPI0038244752
MTNPAQYDEPDPRLTAEIEDHFAALDAVSLLTDAMNGADPETAVLLLDGTFGGVEELDPLLVEAIRYQFAAIDPDSLFTEAMSGADPEAGVLAYEAFTGESVEGDL